MNLKHFMKKHHLTRQNVIDCVSMTDPKFGKVQMSMALNPAYGVQLSPRAVRALKEAFEPSSLKKKPRRTHHCPHCGKEI